MLLATYFCNMSHLTCCQQKDTLSFCLESIHLISNANILLQIPCKHVFCLSCARAEPNVCARCHDPVVRVEQTGLGTVFMCTFATCGATCKRTYLSQRDLQVWNSYVLHQSMAISCYWFQHEPCLV